MRRRGPRTPGVDPALRHAIRNRHRSGAAGLAQIQPASTGSGNFAHTKLRLKGDKPFFNDWESFVVDQQREKLYSYGGVLPHDDSNTPTRDFHCLDLKTMEWQNLTDSLRFRPRTYVSDPFLKDVPQFEFRQLPALIEPAIALISVGDGTFLFLFGGHDSQNPTSDLIAIDLDLSTWWFVDVQGTPISPRMAACMVVISNRLFIFGGRTQFDDNSPAIRTYSIAEYNPQTRWTWTVSDGPLPPDLPLLGYNIQATPVYGGQKILLTQGRVENEKPIDMSQEATIFFHTQNHTFQDARTTMGDFPRGISWYQLGSVVAGPRPSAPVSPRRRGRPPKDPSREIPAIPVMPTYNFPPSVVIVAWVNHSAEDGCLVPEAWQYFLPPTERIRCLNLGDKLWDLNLDLQSFIAVGNRLLLLGSEEGREPINVQSGQMLVDKPLPRWDVAIEISSEYLTE
ncbi:hypothetical protein B0H10DRAFT_2426970 [Mycena sp. CBHHK59/15]|nr:hypothetical protein B0H10DRAFT_2426970 [Mycena sp. CBHHK59/15]